MSDGNNNNNAAASQPSPQTDFSTAQVANDRDFQYKAEMDMGNIATKAEHDHLVENRPKPELEVHLTPDGAHEAVVKQQVNLENERRIQQLQNSLNTAHDRLHSGFQKANSNTGPDRDFSHER